MPDLNEKIPPQAIEAEQAILGALLLDKEAMDKVVEILYEDAFYKEAHSKIYMATLDLYDRNEPIDLITVAEELNKRQQLEEVGGRSYLADLASCVATSANVEHHSRIVLEKAILRKLIETSTDIVQQCYGLSQEVDNLLDQSEMQIFKIAERRMKESFVPLEELLPRTFAEIEEYHKKVGTITGVPTGFERLDEMTAGFQRSDLIVVAGRPSMGKTSLALSIASNCAINFGIPVGIFSLEMSKELLALRMLCSHARLSSHRMRIGKLSDREWANLSIAAGPLSEAKIFVDDTPAIGLFELKAKGRRLKLKHNVGLLIIDYLQLMQGPRKVESRQQEITVICQSLKSLAKELNIPVLALSQLSRKTEERTDRRPQLADLRESGSIEQDADLVLMVYRPEFYDIQKFRDGSPTEGIAEIIIAKHRNGPTGDTKLVFLKDYARFDNLEVYHTEEQAPF